GIGEIPAVAQLHDLADVVQKDPAQEEVAVQARIDRQDALGRFQHGDDVFQEAADVGVMVADAGRGGAGAADKIGVDQEELDQGAEVRVAQLHQDTAELLEQLADVLVGVRQEVGQRDALAVDALNVRQDHLQSALEELHLPLDTDEVTGLERAKDLLAGVP